MTNIWGFLNQTLYVSSMALLIMGLKTLLKDKLPARWQYGVWSVLIFCIFIPADSMGGYIVPQLHIYLEAVKTYVEAGLSSVYSSSSVAVYNSHILPVVTGKPKSITDILFVIYIAGVAFYLARYFIGYFRLKMIISASAKADENTRNSVNDIAAKYGLNSCPVKIIPGLPSAFVFGLTGPILALPKDVPTDEKVILHELIHLKNGDLWQNVFWSVVKALHWPNPFLQFVFKTIHNDMESLCDFRVMEMLKGEERREYGRILLSMTNEKYPSAFGTTSISNGGHFIAERIQAIARFKKYPQGMGIVSVCIVAMLFPLAIKGTAITYFDGNIYRDETSFDYRLAAAKAQMAQCTTAAGAIDTYAKALIADYDLYKIAVQPAEKSREYKLPQMIYYDKYDTDQMYFVLNLSQTATGSYTAQIMFKEFIPGDNYGTNYYLIPVEVIYEKGWKVRQTADYSRYFTNSLDMTYSPPMSQDYTGQINAVYNSDYGKLIINGDTISFTTDHYHNTVPVTDMEFVTNRMEIQTIFILDKACYGFGSVAIGTSLLNDMEFTHDYNEISQGLLGNQHMAMTSSDGISVSNTVLDETFDGVLRNSLIITFQHIDMQSFKGIQFDLWLGKDHYQTLKIDLQAGEVYEQNI